MSPQAIRLLDQLRHRLRRQIQASLALAKTRERDVIEFELISPRRLARPLSEIERDRARSSEHLIFKVERKSDPPNCVMKLDGNLVSPELRKHSKRPPEGEKPAFTKEGRFLSERRTTAPYAVSRIQASGFGSVPCHRA
jgi:hypothetical protein